MKFLIPLDGSDLALDALRHALQLYQAGLPLELVLANVQEGASLYEVVVAHDPEVLADVKARAADHALEAGEALCRAAGVACTRALGNGDIAPLLVEMAEDHGCEAIVLSAQGMQPPAFGAMGSVAAEVLRRSPVPVTVVRRHAPDVEPDDVAAQDGPAS
jgi:nucleotide-binding universal stress UspA family protein